MCSLLCVHSQEVEDGVCDGSRPDAGVVWGEGGGGGLHERNEERTEMKTITMTDVETR